MKRYFIIFFLLLSFPLNINALVVSNDDMTKEIDNIFSSRVSDSYIIEYSDSIDIKEINTYFKSKYMLDSRTTNVYTYEDFINYNKLRNYPKSYGNKYMFEVEFNIKDESEYNKVLEFGSKLKDKYSNLTEDEKVYLVINYIKNKISKDNTTSLYDAIYNHKINESYVLAQFMLSNLNIESYITERLSTGRKYNIVKLNNKWYILDIDNDYILVGYQTADFKPDNYSNDIYVSAYNYNLKEYDIDINEIDSLIIKTTNKVEVVEKIEKTTEKLNKDDINIEINKKELIEWILLIISMCVIIVVIRYYTR